MTISEIKKFYKKDDKKYELEKNKEFLNYLKELTTNGYYCFTEIDELQELINNVANWYELKYPERELDKCCGVLSTDFEKIDDISDVMDIEQLMYRLPDNQLALMNCEYRARGFGQHPIYEKDKFVGWEYEVFIRIKKRNEENINVLMGDLKTFLIHADAVTGKIINNYELEEYLGKKENVSLDELLVIFEEKYSDKLDFSELKESVFSHNCDIELRKKVLQLVPLKLLYSNKTVLENGYRRAMHFINEFNSELGLNISAEEINKAMNINNTKEQRWKVLSK